MKRKVLLRTMAMMSFERTYELLVNHMMHHDDPTHLLYLYNHAVVQKDTMMQRACAVLAFHLLIQCMYDTEEEYQVILTYIEIVKSYAGLDLPSNVQDVTLEHVRWSLEQARKEREGK